MQLSDEKNSRNGLLPKSLRRLRKQCRSLPAQETSRPALGLLPGRNGLLEEARTTRRNTQRLHPAILAGYCLQPALGDHSFRVATQRRYVHLKNLAHPLRPSQTELGRRHQDVELTRFESQRSQDLVVDVGHDAIEHPHPQGDTVASHDVDVPIVLVVRHFRLLVFVYTTTWKVKS